MTWGIAVINHYQVKHGTGKHIYDQSSVGNHSTPAYGMTNII